MHFRLQGFEFRLVVQRTINNTAVPKTTTTELPILMWLLGTALLYLVVLAAQVQWMEEILNYLEAPVSGNSRSITKVYGVVFHRK